MASVQVQPAVPTYQSAQKTKTSARGWWTLAFVLLLTAVIYWPTLRYDLVYDDIPQIVQNPRITSWSYLPSYFTTHVWANIPEASANFYRPLFLTELRLIDAVLGPPRPAWHWPALVAHLCAVLAVFFFVRAFVTNDVAAAVGAGIFALHPVQSEVVSWVSCVSEPLLAVFVVLSLLLYKRKTGPISAASLLCAAAAMLTKETGIVVLLLILAYEWSQSDFRKALTAAAPYALPTLLCLALRANALGTWGNTTHATMTWSAASQTMPKVLALYVGHLLLPIRLSPSYDVPLATTWWPLLLLIALAALVFAVARKRSSTVRFGSAWALICLLPAFNLPHLFREDFVHDRYLYVPLIGLSVLVAHFVSKIASRRLLWASACAVLLLLAIGTRDASKIWSDQVTLFTHVLQVAPKNVPAKIALADAYLAQGKLELARPLLEEATQQWPWYGLGYYNLARYYQASGNYEAAEQYFTLSDRLYVRK